MKRRHLLMVAGLIGSGCLVVFGDKTPATSIAEPVARPVPARSAVVATTEEATDKSDKDSQRTILALVPRSVLLDRADIAADNTLFGNQTWTPPPPVVAPVKPPPPPPPMAPALPFTYIGKKLEGNHWEIYLAQGEQTVIAREKEIIGGLYRVDAIKPPVISLTYLPLKQVQTLTLEGFD
ncbi:hypothetical protein [Collimonas humicola]|uniref:hypothetical protein n=1 Tax=Collimonas humicola TaxID=2825886 RepID=UPI001B8D013E|nr:hypothetical protein [Collimonas humicola]